MEERSILDLLSHFVSDDQDQNAAQDKTASGKQNSILIESLKTLAHSAGSAIDIDEFLSGKGTLLETTRAAMLRSGSSALEEIATILIKQFDIPPGIANTLAGILISLLPSVETETPEKKKPRRKTKPKPKTSSSTSTASSSTKKPAKKKETTKPKTTASKPAAKKKPTAKSNTSKTSASKTSKKTSTSTAKPKKTTRTTTLEDAADE